MAAGGPVTVDDVRAVALGLPRAYEAFVGGRVKFRVGRIVFLTFAKDEQSIGLGFPKEERAMIVVAEPHKFQLPRQSDMRYNWIEVRLAALDAEEMRELVVDAWGMCVPKRVFAAYLAERRTAG